MTLLFNVSNEAVATDEGSNNLRLFAPFSPIPEDPDCKLKLKLANEFDIF
jgi:hypothetical protein